MTGRELLESMNFVEDEIVHESEYRRVRKKSFMGLISMAACLCIIIGSVLAWKYQFVNGADSVSMENASGMEQMVSDGNEEAGECPEADDPLQGVPFVAQYIKTDGKRGYTDAPESTVIQSRDELDEYYSANRSQYDLEHDAGAGFKDVCDQYDESFFAENDLLLIVPGQESDVARYEIQSLQPQDNGSWLLVGKVYIREEASENVNQWQILLEVPKDMICDDDTIVFDFEIG